MQTKQKKIDSPTSNFLHLPLHDNDLKTKSDIIDLKDQK